MADYPQESVNLCIGWYGQISSAVTAWPKRKLHRSRRPKSTLSPELAQEPLQRTLQPCIVVTRHRDRKGSIHRQLSRSELHARWRRQEIQRPLLLRACHLRVEQI
jgi:hypothetical protein